MAFWGTDLTQSDEFCETYDEYVDLYEIGFKPADITPYLLHKYIDLYGDEQNIPHNIYFAIAKAEWMFGTQSETILSKVNEIIENDDNIEYYRSLGFSEEELLKRKGYLLKFQKALKKPKENARKRKISVCNRFKRLPKGTVSWYETTNGYYGFVVLDAVYDGRLLAITEKLSSPPQTKDEILKKPVLTATWLLLRNSPKGNHDIGSININGHYNGRAGVFLCKPISFGINFSFYLDECHRRGLLSFDNSKVEDLLNDENVPIIFFCEETSENETKMVLELMNNPASKLAQNMIRRALYLEDFFTDANL